jgi:hypothetical protein
MCESLATIQESVIERIGFPDMTQYSQDEIKDAIEAWYRAAEILRGQEISGTWSNMEMHLVPGQSELPPGPLQGMFVADHSVRIGTKVYSIGTVTVHAATLRQDETRPSVVHDDHLDIWVVPDGDDTATIRAASVGPGTETTRGTPSPRLPR